ncbi:MAG: PKD domain-containing protein, partial [Chloroflexi bacterium]
MNKNTKILIGAIAALAIIALCLALFLFSGLFSGSDETAGGGSGAPVTAISITSPSPGSIVPVNQAVTVSGMGSGLPEGNVVVQAIDGDGNVLAQASTTVKAPDAGIGGKGPWSVDLSVNVEPGTPGGFRAFSPSPADNSAVAETVVRVTFGKTAEIQSYISISEPVQGAIVDIDNPILVKGMGAGLPEGNVVVEVTDRDGNVLDQQATVLDAPDAGTGGEGAWAVEVNVDTEPGMAGKIRAYSPSPADNSVVAEAVVEVSLGQTAPQPTFIQINKPKPGDVLDISRKIEVTGVGGGLPEGNVVVEAIAEDGTVLNRQPTTIDAPDAGTGGQGPWSIQMTVKVAPGTPGTIRAYSASPADNSVVAEAKVGVIFGQPVNNVPPTAVIEGPTEAFVGDKVTFNGGNSKPGSSPIVSYAWDFGKNQAANQSVDVSASTVYEQPGVYKVSLTVTDQNGLSNTASMDITINEVPVEAVPPTAVINAPNQAEVGQPVLFDGSASQPGNGGNIVRYDWDFGDGKQAGGATVDYTYTGVGAYRVTLTVTDEAGRSGSSQINIQVDAPAVPEPTATPEPLPTDTPEAGGSIEGPMWGLVNTPEGVDITATFTNGMVSGSSGCNTYTGNYTLGAGGTLSISDITLTQQVCADDVMALEQGYIQSLETATEYAVNANQLAILFPTGTLNFINMIS